MINRELALLCAAAMTVTGVWVQWRLACLCSAAEEGVKDQRLTYAQARRRVWLLKSGSRGLTVAGMLLLLASALMTGR